MGGLLKILVRNIFDYNIFSTVIIEILHINSSIVFVVVVFEYFKRNSKLSLPYKYA